ncbi:MAG: hypothetical protein ABI581_11235 [Sediminibacterium sp.]
MARHGKGKAKPNNEVVTAFFTLLNEKIFPVEYLINNERRATYLAEQWPDTQEYKKLNPDERKGRKGKFNVDYIKKTLFDKYKNGSEINLSADYCGKIRKIVLHLQRDQAKANVNPITGDDIGVVNEFTKLFDEKELTQTDKKDIMSRLFGNQTSADYLSGSQWVLYERSGEKDSDGSLRKISVGRILFSRGRKHVEVEMRTKMDDAVRIRIGIATVDLHSTFLFLDMINEKDPHQRRANMVLSLITEDPPSQSLMVGHFTFYSRLFEHLLSKTVVLERIDSETDNHVKIGDYSPLSDEYNKHIPEEIRQFLYPRIMNRMSLPKETISNIDSLRSFLKKKKAEKISEKILLLCQDYYVYYMKKGSLVEDNLSIKHNTEEFSIDAHYKHSANKASPKKWLGKVYHNGSKQGISLELSNEKRKDGEDDPILLIFWIPSSDNIPNYECFPGLISGLEDDTRGPISFECLLVAKKVNFDRVKDKRILNHLKNKHSILVENDEEHFMLSGYPVSGDPVIKNLDP